MELTRPAPSTIPLGQKTQSRADEEALAKFGKQYETAPEKPMLQLPAGNTQAPPTGLPTIPLNPPRGDVSVGFPQRSQISQTSQPTPKITPSQGDKAQSIKNSNKGTIPETLSPKGKTSSGQEKLIQEAKKYKTVDEFLNSRMTADQTPLGEQLTQTAIRRLNEAGIPVTSGDEIITLYHGTNAKGTKGINESKSLNPFSYLATSKEASEGFSFGKGGSVFEVKVPVKDAGYVMSPMAGKGGVTIQNPVRLVKGDDGIYRAEKLPTKEELTEIYKQSHGKLPNKPPKLK